MIRVRRGFATPDEGCSRGAAGGGAGGLRGTSRQGRPAGRQWLAVYIEAALHHPRSSSAATGRAAAGQ